MKDMNEEFYKQIEDVKPGTGSCPAKQSYLKAINPDSAEILLPQELILQVTPNKEGHMGY